MDSLNVEEIVAEIEHVLDEAAMTLSVEEYESLIDRIKEDGYGL